MLLVSLACLLAACTATGDDTDPSFGGKGDGNGTCTDPHYADGTCQVDLGCGIPDIDCYITFATDAEAAAWATQRYPAAIAPETDPTFVKARGLLDRAWKLYAADVPLAKLAEARVALVLIEDPTANAFAMADGAPGKAGLSVQVNRGLVEGGLTDDEIVAVLLHELTHLVKLHVFEEVSERTRRFYVAASPEQIGATTPEVAQARTAGLAWRASADLAGIIDDARIDALPYDGIVAQLLESYPTACYSELQAALAVDSSLAFDQLIQGIAIPDSVATAAAAPMAALRTCATADPTTLRSYVSTLDPSYMTWLEQHLTPEDAGVLDGPALTGMLDLLSKHRAAMRKAEADFTAATGQPWSKLRFFSSEEEADDYSARISVHQHLAPDVASSNFLPDLGAERPACEAALAAGDPPYGQMLNDDHHAECWRVMHTRQVAAAAATPTTTSRPAPATPWTPTRRESPHPVY